MIQEAQSQNRLQSMIVLSDNTVQSAVVHVTLDNFKEEDSNMRPIGWRATRLR